MKITEKELKLLINEELKKITNENFTNNSPTELLREALIWIFSAATEKAVKEVAGPNMSKKIILNSILNNLKKLKVDGVEILYQQVIDLPSEEEEKKKQDVNSDNQGGD